jgi:acetoin utilization deacetylase AcuC-like enzyme
MIASNHKKNGVKIIYSPACLEYQDPGHPESPARVEYAAAWLKKKGYKFIGPEPAGEEDLLLVHDKDLINRVKTGNFFEADTPNLPGIYDYARHAVGGAIAAADLAVKGEPAFSLMRPPGHHAGRHKLGGFCYFNNLAVAVKKLLARGQRVAIIDFDVHHGNGTQDIFLGEAKAVYVSLHRIGIYPSTGYESEDNCYNFPFADAPSPDEYLAVFKEALKIVYEFNADILAVSAGFDGYEGDPLVGLGLMIETYSVMGAEIAKLCKSTFAVLEGGYSDKLGECVGSFLKGWESV